MAFEMVETSQVYLRTLAKIDPEWILLAARDLLKYHYFEPHWSKKAGIVNAYAQISLFGLIIEPKRLINFEKSIIQQRMKFSSRCIDDWSFGHYAAIFKTQFTQT
jgi:HrpA-like RNA helicase